LEKYGAGIEPTAATRSLPPRGFSLPAGSRFG